MLRPRLRSDRARDRGSDARALGSARGGGQGAAALRDLIHQQVVPGVHALAAQSRAEAEARARWQRTTEVLTETERMRAQGIGRALPRPGSLLSHDSLRQIADGCLLNAAIHARRLAGIRSLWTRWSGQRHRPGLAIVHRDHNDPRVDTQQIPDLDARIRRVEEVIFQPNKKWAPRLQMAMSPWVEDHLTLDRGVLNVTWDASRSQVTGFSHVDGATVWPSLLWIDQYIKLNGIRGRNRHEAFERAYERAYSEFGGVDLSQVAYVQVDEQDPAGVAFLAERDVVVSVAHPSPRLDHFGYGRGPCERSWVGSTLYLFGLGYVLDYFQNSLAGQIGLVWGMEPEDVTTMVGQLRARHAGPGQQHTIPFIPMPDDERAKLEFVETRKATAADMEYSQTIHHVAMLATSFYPISPSDLNLNDRGPGAGSALSEPNREGERRAQRDEGLINMGSFCCEAALTPIVQMIDPELKAIWAGIDDDDEGREIDLRVKEVGSYRTINQARLAAGDEPLDEEYADHPQWAAQQILQNALQQKSMQAQAQMQGGEPGGEDEGASPGGGREQGKAENERPDGDSDDEQDEDDRQAPEQPDGDQGERNAPAPAAPAPPPHPHLAWQEPGERAKAAAFVEVFIEDL